MGRVFGPNGSGDAIGTWLLLMAAGGFGCTLAATLAWTGRWRSWYRPAESPVRYGPLLVLPFGVGCLIELVAILVPLSAAAHQVVAVVLLVCLLASALLFLKFPASLRPAWIRSADDAAGSGHGLET